jgi:phenylalanyl-tRNA synthetase beta chain
MPLTRDFAFLVPASTPDATVVRAAGRAEPKLVSRGDVRDVWEGDDLPPDMKSVAIEVVLQPQDQPLDDAAIQRTADAIVDAVAKGAGGQLRGGHA